MNEAPPNPPDPTPIASSGAPLEYRTPGAEPKSQWITDDQPGHFWLVGCLLVLTALGAVAGAVWGVVSLLAGC